MGTKGTTNIPITMRVRSAISGVGQGEGEQNIKVDGSVVTTPAGNMPIETKPESYLFNNSPKSPLDGSGGGDASGSPVKQLGVDAAETAAFEKSKEIESKFDDKIQKAGGYGEWDEKTGKYKNPKINRLNKRAGNKMKRKVPRAAARAAKKGHTMGDGTFLPPSFSNTSYYKG